MALMKYVQGDAHRFALRGRHTGGKHVLVDVPIAGGIARSRYGRKGYFPRFPPKRMCVETRRHPKGNRVSWYVVGLNDIFNVGIIKVSPTTKLNVQLLPIALSTNAVPGD